MPYATFRSDGEIDALYRDDGPGRTFLALDSARTLHFLLEGDMEFAASMLQATDKGYKILLYSLIHLLTERHLLEGDAGGDAGIRLEELLNRVEGDDPDVRQSLALSDTKMVRVIEDVLALLIDKGIFRFADLPEASRQILMVRRELRYYLADDEAE